MSKPSRKRTSPRRLQKEEERRATMRPHPTRDEIVDAMRVIGEPVSPTQLSRITGRSLGSTAYHVRALKAAGVVELAKEGRRRGAVEHFYGLVANEGQEVRVTDPVRQLLVLAGAMTVPSDDGGYPSPTIVDDEARHELTKIVRAITPKVRRLAAVSTKRASTVTRSA